jgi:hypothetical protein
MSMCFTPPPTIQEVPYGKCERPAVVISDSPRVLAEMQFAAQDRLAVAHCCSQAVHANKVHYAKGEFPFQEAVDLYMMGASRKLFASSIGGFSILGRYWTGRREGTEFVLANKKEEVREAMKTLLKDSGCENKERFL